MAVSRENKELLELTDAEKLFDQVVEAQRRKGRVTYGRGLDWQQGAGPNPAFDWRQEALEEAADMNQYLCAEILRLRHTVRQLELQNETYQELHPITTFTDYQRAALVTAPAVVDYNNELAVRALGLAGEAGEVVELVKKHLGHGHGLDVDEVRKELGDVLWYVATLADHLGLNMGAVAEANIKKLRARYPNGFSADASINRTT